MKKRWTALLLALAMLSALAVGALADEQKKDETAAETAQTTPDAAGTPGVLAAGSSATTEEAS